MPNSTDEVQPAGFFETPQLRPPTPKFKGLHEALNEGHITRIFNQFEKYGKRLNEAQLQKVLARIAKIVLPQEEFSTLFCKINITRDGFVTWDEFISYLILMFQQEEISDTYESLEPPIPVLPIMIKSNHRHPVNRITFSPTVKPDRTMSWHDGSVMTCSKDGIINYWSLDMQLERTVQSKCHLLKVQPTWVLDMVVLPDVSVVCTSSTERDLRFYDTSARKFELRIIFSRLDYAVTAMHYVFSQNVNKESKLMLGDMHGCIMVIFIQSLGRGPFKSTPGIPLLHVRFDMVVKNQVPGFRVVLFGRQHTDFVRQMSYYPTLHSIVSCAGCPKKALLMIDLAHLSESKESSYVYKIPCGAWCFAVEAGVHVIATGSPDCLVRLWNPFVPTKPIAFLYGHHSGIATMILQDNGKRLYSLSTDKCIKVWDIAAQSCIQTYLSLPQQLGEQSLTTLYNPESRQWIIGSGMLAVIPMSPKLDGEHTDGNTHVGGISVVLYNKLYKRIVTCGLDSYIILWDPWIGKRMCAVKNAHTRTHHGEIVNIEITAACFDPGDQRLLTGAHDGSLKIWNFNTGTCLRNMQVGSEITAVIWVKSRILAVGWNRRVTEFSDSGEAIGPGGSFSKNWDLRHSEDISDAAVRIPQALATTTFSGELIFWRLETGQAYKQYIVSEPTARIKIQYKPVRGALTRHTCLAVVSKKHRLKLATEKPYKKRKQQDYGKEDIDLRFQATKPIPQSVMTKSMTRRSISGPDSEGSSIRKLAVHCILFLNTRPLDPEVGSLLVSLETGNIQVWSHHINGGFMTSFSAVHKSGDYVISMTSTDDDEYLFTGTSIGYIKIWHLRNYATNIQEPVCMPKIRLQFPFLWHDLFLGRAKRAAAVATKTQMGPLLLNSYRAHRMSVSGIIYIEPAKIIVSCSTDSSCRMWTLAGRYLQTLGTFKPWKNVGQEEDPTEKEFDYTIPPDIKRVASSTTYRVLVGGSFPKPLTMKQMRALQAKEATNIDQSKIFGKRLLPPILGDTFKLASRCPIPIDIGFDTAFPYIPVYQHLTMPTITQLVRPLTPPQIKDLKLDKKA